MPIRSILTPIAMCSLLCPAALAGEARPALMPSPASFTWRAQPQPSPDPAPEPPPAAPSFFEGWKGTIEGGVNGSSGNSETLNLRAALSLNRATERMKTAIATYYAYGTSDGEKNKSRGELGLRNDWSIDQSRWSIYAQGKVEYDEFQDWNWRLSGVVGLGYALIKDERTSLVARLGVGGSRELGGSENDFVPELNLGADFAHQLTERQRLFASFDAYPSLKDTNDYRFVATAGWEILVDPEVNMTLKLGVEDRYDSTPGPGRKKNDVDYFLLLGWTF